MSCGHPKNDHFPTHKQHVITTKKLGLKKGAYFSVANELFWETPWDIATG